MDLRQIQQAYKAQLFHQNQKAHLNQTKPIKTSFHLLALLTVEVEVEVETEEAVRSITRAIGGCRSHAAKATLIPNHLTRPSSFSAPHLLPHWIFSHWIFFHHLEVNRSNWFWSYPIPAPVSCRVDTGVVEEHASPCNIVLNARLPIVISLATWISFWRHLKAFICPWGVG